MMDSSESQERLRKNIIEAVIKVAVLGVMAVWTFQLIKPFLVPFVWGMILAVAAEPPVAWFTERTGGRRTLVAVLFVLTIVALLVRKHDDRVFFPCLGLCCQRQ